MAQSLVLSTFRIDDSLNLHHRGWDSYTSTGLHQAANTEFERSIDASAPAANPQRDPPDPQSSIRFHFLNGVKSRPEIPLQIGLELHPSRSGWRWLVIPGVPIPPELQWVRTEALFLSVDMQCMSQPGVNIEYCAKCQKVQNKRAAKRRAVATSSMSTTQNGAESADLPEGYTNLVVFNRAPKGVLRIHNCRVLIFPRVTCYSSHHPGSKGFVLKLTLSDVNGQVVAHGRTPPILIKDDRKTNGTSGMQQGGGAAAANSPLSHVASSIPPQDAIVSHFLPPSSAMYRPPDPVLDREGALLSPSYWAFVDVTSNPRVPQQQAESRLSLPLTVTQPADTAYLPFYSALPLSNNTPPMPSTPHIQRINPKSGSVIGGTEIEVFGTGFSHGQQVFFGGIAAPMRWDSDTHCVAISPPGYAAGAVWVWFGIPHESPIQFFTYEDSRENDLAMQILKTVGLLRLGYNADVRTVATHLFERLGVPSPLPGWVSSGPSPFAQEVTGASPEHAAIEMLRLLDENSGQDYMPTAQAVLQASDAGQTALHLSASLGFQQLSHELVVRGVDPNQRDINGYTASRLAALYEHSNHVWTPTHMRA